MHGSQERPPPRVGRPQRPIDPASGPVAELASELRELRTRAGSPGYRALAKKAHYSASTLADAAKGDRLPTLEVTLAYVQACGGDTDAWEARWRAAAEVLRQDLPGVPREGSPAARPPCPYPGLAAYTERDAAFFFGRGDLVKQIVRAIEEPGATSLTAVFGASGSGKSSLVHAGVLPALRPRRRLCRLTPGARPLSELARTVIRLARETSTGPAGSVPGGHDERAFPGNRPGDHDERGSAANGPSGHGGHASTEHGPGVHGDRGTVGGGPGDHGDRGTAGGAPGDHGEHASTEHGPSGHSEHASTEHGPSGHGERGLPAPPVPFSPSAPTSPPVPFTPPGPASPDIAGDEAAARALASRLRADPDALRAALAGGRAGRRTGDGAPDSGLLLAVDQFEEVFTLCPDEAERNAFIAAVAALGEARDEGTHVLLAVRADFYAHCCAHPRLAAVLRASRQLPIGPPSDAELREIVAGPAVRLGTAVDPELTATLLAAADGRPGALPLLSHVLRGTWLRGGGTALRMADYRASGGLFGAVAQTAEAVYASVGEPEREMTRALFLRLTALGEGTADTRRRVSRAELTGLADAGTVDRLLDTLSAARLVTLGEQGADSVEVSHEAVIEAWPRLRGWLTDDREALLTHRRLTEAAVTWDEFGRDRELVYRGARLAAAESWAVRHGHTMNDLERAFLAAGTAAGRRRVRRSRQVTGGMAVLLVLALVAAVAAVQVQRSAGRQRDTALSEKVAEEATDLRRADPALAAQLGLAAYRLSPTLAARGALLSSFAVPMSTRLRYEVNTVAFTRDGTRMATGGDDRRIRVWDVRRPHHPRVIAVVPGDQPEDVEWLDYSDDGTLLVSGAYDGSVRIWDTGSGVVPRLLIGFPAHREAVFRAVLSPDARVLATASADGTVGLWDISRPRSPRRLARLTGHTATVEALAFAPDGRTLATGSDDGGGALWDVSVPGRPRRAAVLPARAGEVSGVAFSPDGRTLAAAGADHLVRLWDVSRPAAPVALAALDGHAAPLTAVAFSPDGRTMATGGYDFAVRLWDLSERRRPRPLGQLAVHTNLIWSLTFSPDGRTLASASADHTAALTEVPGAVLGGHGTALTAAAVSPDGRLAVVGSEDRAAGLWDIRGPARRPVPLAAPAGHTGQVKAVAFSRDGRTLVTGGIDTTLGLWDVTAPGRPARVATVRTGADVRTVAMHPDGSLLAAAGGGASRVRLWDVHDPARPRAAGVLEEDAGSLAMAFSPRGGVLAVAIVDGVHLWEVRAHAEPRRLGMVGGHSDSVQAVAFGPDGRTLATTGLDGTVRLWDVRDPDRPRVLATLTGHIGGVQGVAFAPDGRLLATAGQDGTVRLWNTTDPRHPSAEAVLTGHTGQVYAVAFTPDGGTLLSSGEDRTARLWPTRPGAAAARICAGARPRITPTEWHRHFPAVDYHPPCPADG
ncbi:hypothetical protein NX801_19305 [Streptomyces sp. LP05-1]|uniref:HTH cro/C1-type domain-containing protein n=1 Tax=Streptomyces pyxinae TaxID=2970734 RepID=A0ABT2CK26_9ACTN|nr:hypothetical protein [Streptomyces sp. LP05-1]MCS0637773.1 hypothetical protein [Streptomyces sp. LP05-1]